MPRCVSTYEREARQRGFSSIAGVDEVGRGCLFGPVVAAAVILDPARRVHYLRDSKVVEEGEREELANEVKSKARAWAIGAADVFEIDGLNIYQAARLAMTRAVRELSIVPDFLLIDAMRLPLAIEQRPLIGGDARCRAIAAASLVAKVHRDELLNEWDSVFPQYGLRSNKGYSTPRHRRALREHGPTFLHRFSFAPVRQSTQVEYWSRYWGDPTIGAVPVERT